MKNLPTICMSLLLVLAACKKETKTTVETQSSVDSTAPYITLKGKANDTVPLGANYIDPGAIAGDDIDGDLTPFVVSSGSVLTGTVGNYIREYNVKDAAGNVAPKRVRNVRVRNEADYLNGSYTAVCGCTVNVSDVPPPTPTITSNTYTMAVFTSSVNNNSGSLSRYPKAGPVISYNNPMNFNVNGNGMSVFLYGNGSGTISAGKTSFTVTTTENDPAYPARTTQCRVVHTRN